MFYVHFYDSKYINAAQIPGPFYVYF